MDTYSFSVCFDHTIAVYTSFEYCLFIKLTTTHQMHRELTAPTPEARLLNSGDSGCKLRPWDVFIFVTPGVLCLSLCSTGKRQKSLTPGSNWGNSIKVDNPDSGSLVVDCRVMRKAVSLLI